LRPNNYKVTPLPPQNRRKRGGPVFDDKPFTSTPEVEHKQLTPEEALAKLDLAGNEIVEKQGDNTYCSECYLPLHPDPKPERLYIFLHALRYTTSLGRFETEMPEWAKEGWVWDTS